MTTVEHTPLLSVRDLSIRFATRGGDVDVVHKASFDLAAGETLALVGESGSGKSVTALSILQLLNPHQASYPSGSIQFKGEEILGAPPVVMQRMRGDQISMIFQEPMTSLNPLHTIEKQLNEVLLIHRGLNKQAARDRSLELLSLVGLDQVAERLGAYPHQLSGGQRQRVMIAMALANEPDVLIADEPTTALDVTVQAQILALLKELQEKLGLAILLITHDLTVVKNVAHRVCVMRHGKLLETGNTRSVFANPTHPYTQELIDSEPRGRGAKVASTVPPLLSIDNLKVHFPIRRGIFRRLTGMVKAVDGLSLELRPGETLGVVGESGSGKSTLAQGLLRLVPSEGTIVFDKQPVHELNGSALKALRSDMQIVFQDPFGSLSPRMSIADIILEGLKAHDRLPSAAEADAKVVQALNQVGLDPEVRFRYPHEFSGGQRQRVAIARALILEPRLIVLDEPTSALDRAVQVQLIELLSDLQARLGLAYVFISHDLKVVRAMSSRIIVMQAGKAVEVGDADDIFDRPSHPYTQELIRAAYSVLPSQ